MLHHFVAIVQGDRDSWPNARQHPCRVECFPWTEHARNPDRDDWKWRRRRRLLGQSIERCFEHGWRQDTNSDETVAKIARHRERFWVRSGHIDRNGIAHVDIPVLDVEEAGMRGASSFVILHLVS